MEILIFGATRGALYALVAVGFVLVFSVGGILNLAHGTLFMLGAYFTYIFYAGLFDQTGQLGLLVSMAMSIVSVSMFSLFLYYFVYRRRIESTSYVMIISLAVALFVSELMALLYGVTSTSIPPFVSGSQILFGARIMNQELMILPVVTVVLGGLWYFLHSTRLGKAVAATAQNSDGALLVGINTKLLLGSTIAISAALAGIAGIMVAPLVTVVPDMWVYWLIKAFAIAIVGGLGSIPGAILAAFVLSFAEVITAAVVGNQYADLVALVVIAGILVFKPSGLLGTRQA